MVDCSRWTEIVTNAELALASGRPLDPIAYRLTRRIIQTSELVARSSQAFWTAAKIHERGLVSLREEVIRVNERTWRIAARAEAVLMPPPTDR